MWDWTLLKLGCVTRTPMQEPRRCKGCYTSTCGFSNAHDDSCMDRSCLLIILLVPVVASCFEKLHEQAFLLLIPAPAGKTKQEWCGFLLESRSLKSHPDTGTQDGQSPSLKSFNGPEPRAASTKQGRSQATYHKGLQIQCKTMLTH